MLQTVHNFIPFVYDNNKINKLKLLYYNVCLFYYPNYVCYSSKRYMMRKSLTLTIIIYYKG